MAIPEQYINLVRLNEYIRRFVTSSDDKSIVMPGGWDLFPGIDFLERTYSSANKFDCLIHSFLNATCSNFRRLTKEQKNRFADEYRRKVFINIVLQSLHYEHQSPVGKKRIKAYALKEWQYLEDDHIIILCEYYHIKMVVFEVLVGERKRPSMILYGNREGFNTDDDEVYMIYNPGKGHFEAVRTKDDKIYSLPLGLINDMSRQYFNSSDVNPNLAGWNNLEGEEQNSSLARATKESLRIAPKPSSVARSSGMGNPFGNNNNTARAIVSSLKKVAAPSGEFWICPECYEDNPIASPKCYNCGTKRPGRGGRRTRKARGRGTRRRKNIAN